MKTNNIIIIFLFTGIIVNNCNAQSYMTDAKSGYVPTTSYTPNFNAIGGMLNNAQSNYNQMLANGNVFDIPSNQWYNKNDILLIYQRRIEDIKFASKNYMKSAYYSRNAIPNNGEHIVYLINIEQDHPILYRANVYVKKGKIKYLDLNDGRKYVPKNNNIVNGKVESKFTAGLFGTYKTPYLQITFCDASCN